jgi:hypothetical protein
MKHIKYPKTKQLSEIVQNIKHTARFIGVDENGKAKYDNSIPYPKLKFKGTVKIHGTNAGVCLGPDGNIYIQSRGETDLTKMAGHFGFHQFVIDNEWSFKEILLRLMIDNSVVDKNHTIAVYGEWCGPGIVSGSSVAELEEKVFVIFGVKVQPLGGSEEDAYWLDYSKIRVDNPRIFNVDEFGTFEKEIDFERPKMVVNELIDITNEVEKSCPVAKGLGIDSDRGEGVVWTTYYKGKRFCFKVKGSKHSNTKVKKLASVDTEKLESIESAIEYLVTENRLDQALHETKAKLERSYTGDVIRWIGNDIREEEESTLTKNNLVWKDVAGRISEKYRTMFFKRIDDSIFN